MHMHTGITNCIAETRIIKLKPGEFLEKFPNLLLQNSMHTHLHKNLKIEHARNVYFVCTMQAFKFSLTS